MIQLMQQYYTDERNSSIVTIAASILFLIMAGVLWRNFEANPISRGISTGLLIAGLLVMGIGAGGIFYNNKKLKEVAHTEIGPPQTLQQSEMKRMDKVMNKTFKYAFITFAVLMAVAIGIVLFAKGYYWKGIGIAIMLWVALFVISDTFSMHRNKSYLEQVKAWNT